MVDLKNLKFDLNNVVSTISNLTDMEYAIFNVNAELISSTKEYSERKGQIVHTASIDEVLTQGNVIVNKPGMMPSCEGCRFVKNCPSKIEILSCIKLNDTSIGVVSLTSFSQEGHNIIEENVKNYMEILKYISNLVSMFAANENTKKEKRLMKHIIEEVIESSNHNHLILNNEGLLMYWDSGIINLFSYCDLYTQSIDLMFPKEITNWIFSSTKACQKYCVSDKFEGVIELTPIKVENDISGYSLQLNKSDKKLEPISNLDSLGAIITRNSKMDEIKNIVIKLTNSKSSVLITGETGTGKELVAKALHYSGDRAHSPFIPINCANIPDSLFESEIFGYEEGAFTGARKGGKPGLFETANGGCIFFDEIGEMPVHLQAKLLRVLQDNNIRRLGSTNSFPVDVRVIAATNKDLEDMIIEGTFREDLFYRLSVIPIDLPPLRKRVEDIDILTIHFIEKYSLRLDKNVTDISKAALGLIKSYSWPGNIRELENAIEYAINMEETNTIQAHNLPQKLRDTKNTELDLKDAITQREIDLITDTLNKYGWDSKGKNKASEVLGISTRTIYRRLKELDKSSLSS